MRVFDVYLFDEKGALLQVVPIRTTTDDEARRKAGHLKGLHRAAAHLLMPFNAGRTDGAPNKLALPTQ